MIVLWVPYSALNLRQYIESDLGHPLKQPKWSHICSTTCGCKHHLLGGDTPWGSKRHAVRMWTIILWAMMREIDITKRGLKITHKLMSSPFLFYIEFSVFQYIEQKKELKVKSLKIVWVYVLMQVWYGYRKVRWLKCIQNKQWITCMHRWIYHV